MLESYRTKNSPTIKGNVSRNVSEKRSSLCHGSCHLYGNSTSTTGIGLCDATKTNGSQGFREISKFIQIKDNEQPNPSDNKNSNNCGSSSKATDEVYCSSNSKKQQSLSEATTLQRECTTPHWSTSTKYNRSHIKKYGSESRVIPPKMHEKGSVIDSPSISNKEGLVMQVKTTSAFQKELRSINSCDIFKCTEKAHLSHELITDTDMIKKYINIPPTR